MGEKMGFFGVLIIFAVVIIPFMFHAFNVQTQGSTLLATASEVQQLVASEGGVTAKVKGLVTSLNDRGYTISFKNESGNVVNGKVDAGKNVIIHYEYEGFEVNNTVTVLNR